MKIVILFPIDSRHKKEKNPYFICQFVETYIAKYTKNTGFIWRNKKNGKKTSFTIIIPPRKIYMRCIVSSLFSSDKYRLVILIIWTFSFANVCHCNLHWSKLAVYQNFESWIRGLCLLAGMFENFHENFEIGGKGGGYMQKKCTLY